MISDKQPAFRAHSYRASALKKRLSAAESVSSASDRDFFHTHWEFRTKEAWCFYIPLMDYMKLKRIFLK